MFLDCCFFMCENSSMDSGLELVGVLLEFLSFGKHIKHHFFGLTKTGQTIKELKWCEQKLIYILCGSKGIILVKLGIISAGGEDNHLNQSETIKTQKFGAKLVILILMVQTSGDPRKYRTRRNQCDPWWLNNSFEEYQSNGIVSRSIGVKMKKTYLKPPHHLENLVRNAGFAKDNQYPQHPVSK